MNEEIFKLSLGLFVVVLLVESDDSLGHGLAGSEYLIGGTTTTDADADVQVLEAVSSEKEDGLEDLGAHGLGLNQMEGLSIDSDESSA